MNRFDYPETLDTQRLTLRRATEADLPPYCRIVYADPEIMRRLPGGQPVLGAEAEQRARAHLVDHSLTTILASFSLSGVWPP